MTLVVLTGASGSGKTTITREFSRRYPSTAQTCFFDSVGVPSPEEMIRDYGSGEEWQRAKTVEWMADIAARLSTRSVLFEGQMRLAFVHEAAAAAGIFDYTVILVDCDDETRRRRLMEERRQANLASDEMINWARFLREEAQIRGDRILDTSCISLDQAVEFVRSQFP